jgi:hypothetical protein
VTRLKIEPGAAIKSLAIVFIMCPAFLDPTGELCPQSGKLFLIHCVFHDKYTFTPESVFLFLRQ